MRKTSYFGIFLVLAGLLSACASPLGAPSQPGKLKVLATESFLADIAQNVAGSRAAVETLLPVIVDPHEYEPTPQDIARLANSSVLIVNGLGYETWLQKTLDNLEGQRLVIVATQGQVPDPDPSGAHSAGDPHMWMDPVRVIAYVQNIRDGLTQADPAGKDVYASNAAAYIARLKDLDAWVRAQTAALPQARRLIVTNHDALGYFAGAYGFKIIGAIIPSVSPDSAPSAQQMAGLIDTIKTSGAPAIFLDISENSQLANQVAAETGVKVVTDLYVETLSAPGGSAPTYIDMIKHDVAILLAGLA